MRMKRRKMKNLRPIRRLVQGKQDFQLTMKLYKNSSETFTPEEREKFYKEIALYLEKIQTRK